VTKNTSCFSARSNVVIVELDEIPMQAAGTRQGDLIRVCEGSIVDLMANHGPPVVDISWTGLSGNIILNQPDQQTTSVSGLQTGNNQIVLSYSYRGCLQYSTDTITIFVEGYPVAENDAFSVSYNSTPDLAVLDNDRYSGNITVRIISAPSTGTVTLENNMIRFRPDIQFVGQTSVTYEICSVFCPSFCSTAVAEIEVEVEKDCRPPNIITPNEDGINDSFIIPCLFGESFPGNKLVIFNEWGNEVFSASNYNNDWKGLYNGSPLPGGTYFYVLDLADGNTPLNGFLILQR
jgi:gliding motility-associated-like protein